MLYICACWIWKVQCIYWWWLQKLPLGELENSSNEVIGVNTPE